MLLLGWQSVYCARPETPQKPRHSTSSTSSISSSWASSGDINWTEVPKLSELSALSELPDVAVLDDQGSPMPFESGDDSHNNSKDPGYKLYKEGYKQILNGGWVLARNKFKEMLSQYPRSEYVDDAEYWSAYALKYIDTKKAIAAYKDFLAKYPKSTYYDDAVADLSQLSKKHHSISSSNGISVIPSDDNDVTVLSGGKTFGYTFPKTKMSLDKLNRSLQKMRITTPHIAMPRLPAALGAPRALWSGYFSPNDTLDEKTKIKMDALYAIGDTKEDSVSYKTLRDVALDPKQPRELRLTAIDALSDFKKFDVLPDFINIASTDKDEEVQNSAINYISDLSGNKDRRVDALIKLFNMLPTEKKEQQETIFYTIADIGNNKAVDFLISVAKTSPNNELRRQAIYYLGNIGGDKARAALYDLLKEN
jgi:hypothetical protein